MAIIYIPSQNRKIFVPSEISLAEALRNTGVEIETPCGGHGMCGGCVVQIKSGSVEILPADHELIPEELLNQGYLLSCRKRKLFGDVSVEIPVKKREVDLKAVPEKVKGEYGFSVDLGTTTLAISLVNINQGIEVGSLSMLNPQTQYGADVITRATLVMEDESILKILRKNVLDAISAGINRLLLECRVRPEDVTKISIAGNSIMEHIILGISPVPLTVAPFEVKEKIPGRMDAKEFGFQNLKNAHVIVFPMIGANAGGDTVAGIYYLDLPGMDKPSLFLDIGTNVEMALVKDGEVFITSSPAGPAFEGGEITFGMRAEDGAIESVKIEDAVLQCRVRGGGKPKGICGSGLISLVSELVRTRVIDKTGRIRSRDEIENNLSLRVKEGERGNIFIIHRDTKISLYLTQSDVRQLQLAKSALRAGIEILLKKNNLKGEDIENVYTAGAFGVAVDESAMFRIGMLPESFRGKLHPSGDTALGGAKKYILSENGDEELKEILDRAHYLELSKEKDFEKEFIKHMNFIEEEK